VQGELTHISENCPIQATQAIRARGGGGPLCTDTLASILKAQKEDLPLSGPSVLATAPLRLPWFAVGGVSRHELASEVGAGQTGKYGVHIR
jgi:hypothetical protein